MDKKGVIILQEQVNEKTVSLAIRAGKLTVHVFQKALCKLLAEMKQQQKGKSSNTYHGKQSVKELVGQGVGVSNIEITDKNIKSFDRVARKYGVDYALKKDASGNPPKWLVFFKARDADALTAAFQEYTTKTMKKKDKPPLLTTVNQMKEEMKNQAVDKVRKKDKGLEL